MSLTKSSLTKSSFNKFDPNASSRVLALAAGAIGGVMIAASAQTLLRGMHVELAAVAGDVAATSAAQVRSALAWWLIAGAALAGGFITAATTRILLGNWWTPPWLRWIAGAAVVAALSAIGHQASEPTSLTASAYAAANFSGMVVALIGALIGAFFAARH